MSGKPITAPRYRVLSEPRPALIYEIAKGVNVADAAKDLQERADEQDLCTIAIFNGRPLIAEPGCDVRDIVSAWDRGAR